MIRNGQKRQKKTTQRKQLAKTKNSGDQKENPNGVFFGRMFYGIERMKWNNAMRRKESEIALQRERGKKCKFVIKFDDDGTMIGRMYAETRFIANFMTVV